MRGGDRSSTFFDLRTTRPSKTSTRTAGRPGDARQAPAYSVSKSAILNLTRYLATYWAAAGVRANTPDPRRVRGTSQRSSSTSRPRPRSHGVGCSTRRRHSAPSCSSRRTPRRTSRGSNVVVDVVLVWAVKVEQASATNGQGQNPVVVSLAGRVEVRRSWRDVSPTCARGYSPTVIAHEIPNLVDGKRVPAVSGQWLDKLRPSDGARLCRLARSANEDVAVAGHRRAHGSTRGRATRSSAERSFASLAHRARRDDAAEIVAAETGKPLELALGETTPPSRWVFVAGEGALRPHDDREHASSHCSHRAAAARGCGPDHELQHAAPEPRVEDLPRDLLR